MKSIRPLKYPILAALAAVLICCGQDNKPSPPATADVMLAGKQIGIEYAQPSMRGRKIMGGLVPYGQVWRTGANEATTLITPVALRIGSADVPAGKVHALDAAVGRGLETDYQ